jgi:hypothetical protein
MNFKFDREGNLVPLEPLQRRISPKHLTNGNILRYPKVLENEFMPILTLQLVHIHSFVLNLKSNCSLLSGKQKAP